MDRIGRYEVVRELGQGGMGSVYLGRDPELRRSVALKLLHRENTDFALKQEARVLAALNHPGIVTIFEIGEHDGRQFIAMEYLAGASLRHLLQHPDETPPRDALVPIIAKVALAVDAAHAADILHRDIKPENIVVGTGGMVKVVDFGIARRLHGETPLTDMLPRRTAQDRATAISRTLSFHTEADTVVTAATQTVFGTPAYMAPEVLMGDPSTPASDVYSLGVTLYECLAKRRPYDAPLLHEVIAKVIDGNEPATPLEDPLAVLVERMLAREPSERPALAEIAAELSRPSSAASRSRRTWPWLAAGVGIAALGGGLAWYLVSRAARPSGTAPVRVHVVAPLVVAVPPMTLKVTSYGAQPPEAVAIADVFAMTLAGRNALRIISPQQLEDARGDLAPFRIERWLRGELIEENGLVRGTIRVVGADGTELASVSASPRGIGEIAQLTTELAERAWQVLVPDLAFDRAIDHGRAIDLWRAGTRHMMDRDWFASRPYLEAAVVADPSYFDGWSAVASIRSWTMAPDALIEDAITHALALAKEGPQKEIWRGAGHYYRYEFPEARAALVPLEASTTLSKQDRRDLEYYLGEALWHDGDFAGGFEHFVRVIDFDMNFKPATIHASEYTLARRDIERASQLLGLQSFPKGPAEFAAGRYATLARSELFPDNLHAQYVLDLEPTHETELGNAASLYRFGRMTGMEDRAAAKAAFATMWDAIVGRMTFTDGTVYELEAIAEVALCGELRDELQRILEMLEAHPTKRAIRTLDRLRVLAAPLLGGQAPLVRDGMTSRDRMRAQAIEAELAGDRERAATMLRELVAEPSATWDYPERAALIRNLRALGRSADLRALCADTVQPALFRVAFLPLRRTCRQLARQEQSKR